VIAILMISIIVPILLWIIDFSGEFLVLHLSAAMVMFILLMNILYPIVIIPMYYKLTNLEESELRDAINADAQKAQVPVS
jgi:STE24 endopeptidase